VAYSKVEDGVVVYGASGIGACPVALYYDRQGMTGEPFPERLMQAFSEGVDNEQLILDMLQEKAPFTLLEKPELEFAGYKFGVYDEDRKVDYSDQVRVEAPVLPGVIVRAHLDGVCELVKVPEGWTREQDTDGKRFIVEAKALGDALWEKWKKVGIDIIDHYPWQVSAQMKGAGLPCVFVVGHKDKTGKVFEIDYKILDELPVKWIEVIKKIKMVEAGTIEDTDCPTPFMYPCPFFPLHNPLVQAGKTGMITLDDDNSDRQERVLLLSLAEQLEEHRVKEKHHKEMKDNAQKAVNEWLDEHGFKGGTLSVGAYIVNDIVSDKPGAINGGLMEEAGLDPDKYRGKGYTVRYATVTRKKDVASD
jgi:hypothetical protein